MTKKPMSKLEEIAILMTESVGSVTSLLIHSFLFLAIFCLIFFGVALDSILLILTTAVSLEAIYLAIFIQMTVNRNTESLEAVEEDIDEIQDDVQEIEHDIDEIQVDVDELEKDVDEIAVDMDEDETEEQRDRASLTDIQNSLEKIMREIEDLKRNR